MSLRLYGKSHHGVTAVQFLVLYSYNAVAPSVLSAMNLAYEVVCLALTVIKTISVYRMPSRFRRQMRLTDLLLRDGELLYSRAPVCRSW